MTDINEIKIGNNKEFKALCRLQIYRITSDTMTGITNQYVAFVAGILATTTVIIQILNWIAILDIYRFLIVVFFLVGSLRYISLDFFKRWEQAKRELSIIVKDVESKYLD